MDLQELIDAGYVMRTKHPGADLYIHNYTNKTQYEKMWTPLTMACRGLITNSRGTWLNAPIPKFFNASEHEWKLPNEPYRVFDKMDGSCGILYWWNEGPWIATRGSFTSNQAVLGNNMLRTKYKHTWDKLDQTLTYTFEIIHPLNRVVCDYGDREELVLLSIRDTNTGRELPLVDIGFPIVEEYDYSIEAIKYLERDNSEGFVILFESGLRVKIKHSEYVRLHAIVTQVSSYSIWEQLSAGGTLEDMLDRVPDEFMEFVQKTAGDLRHRFREVEDECRLDFEARPDGTRKEIAEYMKKCSYPGVLFSMLDGKDYSDIIWRLIKPDYSRPFSNEYKNQQAAGSVPV